MRFYSLVTYYELVFNAILASCPTISFFKFNILFRTQYDNINTYYYYYYLFKFVKLIIIIKIRDERTSFEYKICGKVEKHPAPHIYQFLGYSSKDFTD